jgi:hypothetical protein
MGKPVSIIATLRKNQRESVRVALDQWHGHNLLDLRLVVPLAEHASTLTPTAKGLSVSVDLIADLRAALDRAETEARALGWLP